MTDEELQERSRINLGVTKFRTQRVNEVTPLKTGGSGPPDMLGRGREDKDPFIDYYGAYEAIIQPDMIPSSLYSTYESSDVLQACVKAMQKNVDGFGYELVFKGNDLTERDSSEAQRQKMLLENFFDQVNEDQSFQSVRVLAREDYEVVGYSAIEMVRRPKTNLLTFAYYNPVTDTRMCYLDTDPVNVKTIIIRDGNPTAFNIKKKFRRYVQVNQSDNKLKWFKTFGDTRPMDALTGEYLTTKGGGKSTELATELLWIKNNFGGKAYGVPRWIGALTEVAGRSTAQYVNFDLFDNQGIPPMLIIVENGSLTDDSRAELQDLIQSFRSADNFNRTGLLEAVPEITGLDNDSNVKIRIENMISNRNQDLMFKGYMENSYDVIRQAFRLPALYLGGIGVYSYSSAFTAQMLAEQQIFIPERTSFDEVINRTVVWGEFECFLWEYKSKGPQTVGTNDIINAMKSFGSMGATSINNGIDMLNNLMGTQISKINAVWADYPYAIVGKLLDQGRLVIPELETASGLPQDKPPVDTAKLPDTPTTPTDTPPETPATPPAKPPAVPSPKPPAIPTTAV
jgi:PBSX family phage portal protein